MNLVYKGKGFFEIGKEVMFSDAVKKSICENPINFTHKDLDTGEVKVSGIVNVKMDGSFEISNPTQELIDYFDALLNLTAQSNKSLGYKFVGKVSE
jgi:hypothetical protein